MNTYLKAIIFWLISLAIVLIFFWYMVTRAYNYDVMISKADEKTVNRLIRSCENRYEELEVKEWRSVERCVKVSFSIFCNESSCWKYYTNNSIHWIQKSFETQIEAINYWTTTYYKWWYKAKEWSFFYGSENWPAPSLYCTSEASSGTYGWCRNGRKNFNYFYNLIK